MAQAVCCKCLSLPALHKRSSPSPAVISLPKNVLLSHSKEIHKKTLPVFFFCAIANYLKK